jgi:hypothetical protein
LSVLENVILGSEPTKPGGRVDYTAAHSHLVEVGNSYGLEVDPDDLVESLEVGERQPSWPISSKRVLGLLCQAGLAGSSRSDALPPARR